MSVRTFAAIDVGSYELTMKIFEFSGKDTMREIDCVSKRLDLGSDTYAMGKISNEKMDVLRTAVLRIDALFGCPFRRPLRRVHDGQSRRHVLFPAFPMEQRTAVPALSGRQQQLFLRSHFQSGRCVHLCGGSLLAVIPIQVPRQAVTSQGRIHIAFPATEVRLIENGLINNSTANNIFSSDFLEVQKKALSLHSVNPTCPGGGIGRRARFRCVCRKACRFDSCPGH